MVFYAKGSYTRDFTELPEFPSFPTICVTMALLKMMKCERTKNWTSPHFCLFLIAGKRVHEHEKPHALSYRTSSRGRVLKPAAHRLSRYATLLNDAPTTDPQRSHESRDTRRRRRIARRAGAVTPQARDSHPRHVENKKHVQTKRYQLRRKRRASGATERNTSRSSQVTKRKNALRAKTKVAKQTIETSSCDEDKKGPVNEDPPEEVRPREFVESAKDTETGLDTAESRGATDYPRDSLQSCSEAAEAAQSADSEAKCTLVDIEETVEQRRLSPDRENISEESGSVSDTAAAEIMDTDRAAEKIAEADNAQKRNGKSSGTEEEMNGGVEGAAKEQVVNGREESSSPTEGSGPGIGTASSRATPDDDTAGSSVISRQTTSTFVNSSTTASDTDVKEPDDYRKYKCPKKKFLLKAMKSQTNSTSQSGATGRTTSESAGTGENKTPADQPTHANPAPVVSRQPSTAGSALTARTESAPRSKGMRN